MFICKLLWCLPLEIEHTSIVAGSTFSYVRIIWKSGFVGQVRGFLLLFAKNVNEMETTLFYGDYSDKF